MKQNIWYLLFIKSAFSSERRKHIRKKFFIVFLISFLCLLFIGIYFRTPEERTVSPLKEGQTLFDVIRDFANRMEVFPIDILAANFLGPFGVTKTSSGRCNRWSQRYELTFERYIIFHEFKEIACHISKKELLDCVSRIDEATPREKALILVTIFIFERIHRKYPHFIKGGTTNPVIPYYEPDTWTTSWQWHHLITVIKKYEGYYWEIAFPAITIDDEKLKQSWSESYSENFKFYSLIRHPQLVTSTNENNIDSIVQTKLQSFDHNINVQKFQIIFDEYIYTIKGDGLLSGIAPAFGNSSAIPKTLSDIATQLLMSRFPYEGTNK
jgi:hypothetical protein